MSYAETQMNVVRWGEARGIVQNGKPQGQAMKMLEEVGELLTAIARRNVLLEVERLFPDVAIRPEFKKLMEPAMPEVMDAVGDVEVCQTMVCATLDIDVPVCFEGAYQQIKHRKGYLRPDGVFVKES